MTNLVMANKLLANKKRKGFTLVELIVVIVIIAIIAAIAIPRIVAFQDSAKKARIEAEHKELITAVQLWKAAQSDPASAVPENLEALKGYMSLNGKDTLDAVLAKNNNAVAHSIDKATGKLTSVFIPSSGDQNAKVEWIYDIK